MREILFKAKKKDNGEWVEGLLWKKKYDSNKIFISCFPDKDDNEEVFVVEPDTICQYTGLTDKNGRKIWENDIVLEVQPCKRTFKITYDVDAFCFDGNGIMLRVRNARDKVEVIGNVFDNPELLEKAR